MSNGILKHNKEITWSIPCFFQYEPMSGALHQSVSRMHPDEELKLRVYGAPASIWTGEVMPDSYEVVDRDLLDSLFEYYEEINAIPVFSFTATKITPEQLNNEYANLLLDYGIEKKAQFCVYSDKSKNHIKSKYEDAFVIASNIKAIEKFQKQNSDYEAETKYYNELLKEYDMVSLRPEYVKNYLLNNLDAVDDLKRVEISVNYSCVTNCTNCFEHICHIESFNVAPSRGEPLNCPIPFMMLKDVYNKSVALSDEEVKIFFDKGVRYFKIEKGRYDHIPMDVLMLKFASQIFNADGSNFMLFARVLQNQIQLELQYFREKMSAFPYYERIFSANVQQQ